VDNSGQRVIIGVDGSLGSLQALRRGVAEARDRHVSVWAVLAWTPPGGEGMNRRAPCPGLIHLWQEEAAERLQTAWNETFGGVPTDLEVHLLVVRGPAGAVLTQVAERDGDLLVLGSGRRGLLHRVFGHSVARYCVAQADCCVLTVPPSPFERQLQHGLTGKNLSIADFTS
jgi:nucleotide-binding universal stress UspA family protein